MKRQLALASLAFSAVLMATVNDPIRWELFTGYRNDQIHWHLQDAGDSGALAYSERYSGVEFWDNELAVRAIYRDLVFFLQGGYSAFGRGDLVQRFANLSYATDQPHIKFNTDGWAADGNLEVGYAVNLTPDRTYKAMIIPLLGFTYRYESVKGEGSSDWRSDDAVGATSYLLSTRFPKPMRQAWYGVALGGAIRLESGGRMNLECGYQYNWVHLTFHSQFEETLSLFSGADLLQQTETQNKIHSSEGGNLAQTGWAELEYLINPAWRIGLFAQIHYFASQVLSVNQKQTISQTFPTSSESEQTLEQKLKVRWTPVSFYLTISRKF